MKIKIVVSLLLMIGIVASVFAGEIVTFKGATKTTDGDLLVLTGKLTKSQGKQRFPAVVLLHGCNGIGSWDEMWSKRLKEWGYVTLAVDSFGPRGVSSSCDNPLRIMPDTRRKDAHAAKSYLATGQSFSLVEVVFP